MNVVVIGGGVAGLATALQLGRAGHDVTVLRGGLAPALRSDQVVLRAFVRNLNLLSPPDALLTDADFGARVFAVLQTKDQRPPKPSLGPATRADFIKQLRSL